MKSYRLLILSIVAALIMATLAAGSRTAYADDPSRQIATPPSCPQLQTELVALTLASCAPALDRPPLPVLTTNVAPVKDAPITPVNVATAPTLDPRLVGTVTAQGYPYPDAIPPLPLRDQPIARPDECECVDVKFLNGKDNWEVGGKPKIDLTKSGDWSSYHITAKVHVPYAIECKDGTNPEKCAGHVHASASVENFTLVLANGTKVALTAKNGRMSGGGKVGTGSEVEVGCKGKCAQTTSGAVDFTFGVDVSRGDGRTFQGLSAGWRIEGDLNFEFIVHCAEGGGPGQTWDMQFKVNSSMPGNIDVANSNYDGDARPNGTDFADPWNPNL